MKLNNKGFAITGILYTILVLFLLLLSSLLALLSSRINRLIALTDSINNEIEYNNNIEINEIQSDSNEYEMSNPIEGTVYYITSYRGKYEFTINDNATICYAYLPKDTLLTINSGVITYKRPEIINDQYLLDASVLDNGTILDIIGCTNSGINRVTFSKVYTSQEE